MSSRYVFAVLMFVACKGAPDSTTIPDAMVVATRPPVDASAVAPIEDAAAGIDADAGVRDASATLAKGTLSLDVRGSYCAATDKNKPQCRSFTYALEADGTMHGGARKTRVSASDVDAIFREATEALSAKRSCIPYAPDKGGRKLVLVVDGKSIVADGACGARVDAIGAKLEKWASEP